MFRAGRKSPARLIPRTDSRRLALARWSMLLLAVLAIAIQSLVIQPHIHGPITPETGLATAALDGGLLIADESGKNTPLEPDQNNCPMCQSAHQNGHYLKPVAASFALPHFVNYRIVERDQSPAIVAVASHDWQGRAPPQA